MTTDRPDPNAAAIAVKLTGPQVRLLRLIADGKVFSETFSVSLVIRGPGHANVTPTYRRLSEHRFARIDHAGSAADGRLCPVEVTPDGRAWLDAHPPTN